GRQRAARRAARRAGAADRGPRLRARPRPRRGRGPRRPTRRRPACRRGVSRAPGVVSSGAVVAPPWMVTIFTRRAARDRAMMSRMFVRSLVLILLVALGSVGCRGESPAAAQEKPKAQPAGPPPREVRVVPAAERALPRTVAATGTLAAEDQVTLSAKVAGRVEKIDIDLGSRVRRGQAVAQLDQTDFKLRVEQADHALQPARARLAPAPAPHGQHS